MPLPMPPKNKKEFSWGRFSKTLSFWILILLIPVVLIQLSGAEVGSGEADHLHAVPATSSTRDNIKKVTIVDGKTVTGTFKQRDRRSAGKATRSNFTVRAARCENSEPKSTR